MNYDPANPLIVQADRSVLVEVDNPRYSEARDALAPFADLEKSPEHIHTYRLTNLSLWNAAAAGLSADQATLAGFAIGMLAAVLIGVVALLVVIAPHTSVPRIRAFHGVAGPVPQVRPAISTIYA